MAKQHDKQFKLDAVQYYEDHTGGAYIRCLTPLNFYGEAAGE